MGRDVSSRDRGTRKSQDGRGAPEDMTGQARGVVDGLDGGVDGRRVGGAAGVVRTGEVSMDTVGAGPLTLRVEGAGRTVPVVLVPLTADWTNHPETPVDRVHPTPQSLEPVCD